MPRLLNADEAKVRIITSNRGTRVEHLDEARTKEILPNWKSSACATMIPDIRNVTYRQKDGRFCLIDFEFATILPEAPA